MARQTNSRLRLETIPLDSIIPYETNAKTHPDWQVEQIKQAIERQGYNDPIAVDENNIIIEGHGRYLALQRLNYTQVEVIRLSGLTEVQKREYMLAHNKLCINTGFDIFHLTQELDFLAAEDVDFSYLQFTEYVPQAQIESATSQEIDSLASSEVNNLQESSETGLINVKFKLPIELKSQFQDWVMTSLQGTEFEGRIQVS